MKLIKSSSTSKVTIIIASFILIAYTFFIHQPYLQRLPSGIHTWAQSDHFALSKGFVENNLNFFEPQTFVYNHQYPNFWNTPDSSTITPVDFPIHNYLPAIAMKISGSNSPAIYRIYLLIISFIGLFYLFKLAKLFNASTILSLLIVFFTVTMPVFFYYQIRFIPSVPSLSTTFIGFYFYFNYRKTHAYRDLTLGIGLLTLSAMTRTTFIIPLLSVFAVELILLLKNKQDRLKKIFLGMISLTLILSYIAYNAHLRNLYGSVFLNSLLPASSWAEFIEIIQKMDAWKLQYMTKFHYLAILCSIGIIVYFRFIKKNYQLKESDPSTGLLIALLFIGSFSFFVAMCQQFVFHDYYFLDAFALPIILLLCFLSKHISAIDNRIIKQLIPFGSISLSLLFMLYNFHTQNGREKVEYKEKSFKIESNYEGSALLLDQLNIPKTEKILVFIEESPNFPFMMMERKGFVTISNKRKSIVNFMENFPVNYVVFDNEIFQKNIFPNYPEIINYLDVLANNGKITVCRKTAMHKKQLSSFLKTSTSE